MTEEKKKKVVALLSGGLDSQLAIKMMQEQGFDDVNYTRFEYISRLSLVRFTQTIIEELEIKLKDPRHIFINLLTKCLKNQYYFPSNSEFVIFQYTSILIYILRSFKEKFDICFIIMSALYNAWPNNDLNKGWL